MDLVLFDFDKTLTTKDSFIEFLKYTTSPLKYYKNLFLLSPWILAYILTIIDSKKLKNKFLSQFFNGYNEKSLKNIGKEFSKNHLPKILNNSVYEQLKSYVKEKHHVVIVSASLDIWLKPWTIKHQVDLICTKAFFQDNIFKGKIKGQNVRKEVKQKLVLEKYDLSCFKNIIVFGNKNLDEYLFKLATGKQNIHVIP